MELIIVLVLFVGIVGAWLVLPSSPAEQGAHSAAAAATAKVGTTA